MSDTREYKCANCGAPLAFDAASQTLSCANCGSTFTVESLAEAWQTVADGIKDEDQEFSWGSLESALPQETLSEMALYTCQSCGAQIEADLNTAATKCPYCDNNVVLTDRVTDSLKPNAIIPFKISSKELPGVIEQFYGGKKLLPKGFFNASKISEIQGVYVPFWLFDCRVAGNMTMTGETYRYYILGEYDIHETDHFLLDRGGEMQFAHVPVDASVKMPDDLMDSIEPFDYSEMVPFDSAYLSGFLADRFDTKPDENLKKAASRMLTSAQGAMLQTAMGYSNVMPHANRMDIADKDVKYVMMPVYLVNCNYEGKDYQYAVNGQTGKIVGELPISRSRSAATFFKAFGIAAAIAFAAALFLL